MQTQERVDKPPRETLRVMDERAMRHCVRGGAVVVAEYQWWGCGIPELEQRGREWVLQGDPSALRAGLGRAKGVVHG